MISKSVHAPKLIVAHRGYHAHSHENTLEAMRDAIDLGSDMVEFDVRRCADGELVVHHDESIQGKLLAAMPYDEVVHTALEFGYGVPRLTELLQLINGRIGLDIELKEAGYEERVLRQIFDCFHGSNFLITSFDAAALSAVRNLNAGIRLGLLTSDVSAEEAFELFQEAEVDFLAPESTTLADTVFREAERRAIQLLPWTVNDRALVKRCLREESVFGLITDFPEQALRVRNLEAGFTLT
jgi:glycerophosphoryl diester phosphodiesterase